MDTLVKILAIALVSLFLALAVDKHNTTAALAVIIAAAATVLGLAFGAVNIVLKFMRDLSQYASIAPELMVPLYKTTGIAIVTRLAADLCKDKGSSALSACVELSGCAIALTFTFPVLMSVIKLISSI
ncbi:MAG: hypothetical protein GX541_00950 [Clostridiales bacterium]|jgi:stage III sporulation protein AD|nr:hypothetical protein [Clostridiales bacterium]